MKLTGSFILLFIAFWPMFGAFASYLVGRKNKQGRNYVAIFVTVVEFCVMLYAAIFLASNQAPPTFEWQGFMGLRIYLKLDFFRAIYGVITSLMWMMTTLLSPEYFAHYRNRNRYYLFMLFTMTGTIGVFLSADLITTFMFFEMMSFTSYVMVIHDESEPAAKAADTYMAVAVIGGLAMLMGIFLVSNTLGTTEIGQFYEAMKHFEGNKFPLYLAAVFMLIGFGGKAGVYPLHIWLPNAHPVAPAPSSALLSGVLTKTGIFGIIVMSALIFNSDAVWGHFVLVLGVLGMFTGALLALFSINLKRTLACSSVSQIGFIMVGIGMQGVLGEHNALAVRGTTLHMVNHSLIKLVLFMMAGVVYMNLHKLDLNDVRGFGRKKPLFTFAFAVGVLAIIGMPFFSGYISKTMLHESIVEQIWLYPDYSAAARYFQVIECIFTLTGGLTTAYMIKIFTCVCIEKNQFNQDKMTAINGRYMNKASTFALVGAAVILLSLGFEPYRFMIPLSALAQDFMHGHDPAHAVEFFAWINLKGAVASLAIGVIIYVLVVRVSMIRKDEQGRSIYVNLWPKYVDIEEYVYRPLLLRFLPFVGALFARTIGAIPGAVASVVYKGFMGIRKFWVSNSGKSVGGEILADARGFFDGRVANPVDTDKMRENYEKVASRIGTASEVIWEGEGDAMQSVGTIHDGVMEQVLTEADEAQARLPHDGHGHDDHVHDAHKSEDVPEGAYAKLLYYLKKGYAKLRSIFHVRDPRYGDPTAQEMESRNLKSGILRTVLSSLAYSLMLFLIGFVIVLLFALKG